MSESDFVSDWARHQVCSVNSGMGNKGDFVTKLCFLIHRCRKMHVLRKVNLKVYAEHLILSTCCRSLASVILLSLYHVTA